MITAYYNEIDEYAAQWLRNLINAGYITPGDVDTRSITDVSPDDVRGYDRVHLFAGIGVWDLSLTRAGWQRGQTWTASCPCQPFSVAGKGDGFADDRHLWPEADRLIKECRPFVVFGEQVASKDGYAWLDLVQADLEGTGYTVGAVVAPAAGFGAPHQRHRMYWVACAGSSGLLELGRERDESKGFAENGVVSGLADTKSDGRQHSSPFTGSNGALVGAGESRFGIGGGSDTGGMADTSNERRNRQHALLRQEQINLPETTGNGATGGFWSNSDWIPCRDGKYRPVEPSTFPLVNGASARVGRLRAYGNAIVPQAAEAFIRAFMEVRP